MKNILLKINQWGAMLILVAPFLVNNNFIFPYVHLKNIFFRVLILGLIVSLVWYLLEKNRRWVKKNLIVYAWLIFLLILILSAVLGVDIANSFWGSWERMDGVINMILLGIYLCLISVVFRTKQDWVKLFRTSVIVALIISVYGLFRGGFSVSSNEWSTLGNSAFLGFYMLLNLGILATLVVIDKHQRWRWFYLVTGIFLLLILLGAASRAPILGLLVGLIVGGLFYLPQATKKIKIFLLIGLLAIILIGGVARINKDAKWVGSIHFLDRLVHISTEDYTTNNRLLVWQSGWQGFKEKPLTGWGSENFVEAINKYYNPLISEQWFDRAHNFVIDYLVTTGILGLLGYLGIFGVAGYGLWRSRKNNYLLVSVSYGWLSAYLFTSLFVFDTLNSWLLVMVWLAWISWLMRLGEENEIQEMELAKILQKNYYTILGLIVLIGVMGIYSVAYKPMRANYLAGQAHRYSQVDPEKSLALYEQIFTLNTLGQREVVLQLGRYALSAIQAPEVSLDIKDKIFNIAEEKMLSYLEQYPQQLQVRMSLAQNYLAYSSLNSFYINETISLLENNIEDSPQRLEIYYMLAQAYYLQGDLVKVADYLEQAYEVTHEVDSVYENLMNIYSQLGEVEKVDQIIQEYFAQFPELEAEQYRKASEVYFRVGLVEKSEQVLLERAIPADPTIWRSYVSLASIYQAQGEVRKAIDYLTGVLIEHPEFEEVVGEYLEELEGMK